MNDKLLKALIALEPEIRKLGDQVSVTISTDANGTTYSTSVSDGVGGTESASKRVPVKK
jgi:hypothetical protein